MNRYLGKIFIVLSIFILAGCAPTMKAELNMGIGKYEEAITIYKDYLSNNPRNTHARTRYGYALLKNNRIDESIIQFKKVLDHKPGDPESTLYLGMAYLNQGKFDLAAVTWKNYRNNEQPLVEAEIKRLLTTVVMAQAQKEAEQVLALERQIDGVKATEANTLAVGYFKDMSPDKSLRAFQKGLTAMLITDISKIGSFKVVEREKLQALLEEMKLGQTGIIDQESAPRVGRLLKAENMVTGSLAKGSIEAVIGVASTSEGGVKKGSAVGVVEEDQFFELTSVLIDNIFKILQVKLTKEQRIAIGIPHTKNIKAFIHFGNALDELDQGNWPQAKSLLAMAMQEDPKFALARELYNAVPGDNAPTIQAIKDLDAPGMADSIEKSLNLAVAQDAEAKKAFEAKMGTGGGGGGGH